MRNIRKRKTNYAILFIIKYSLKKMIKRDAIEDFKIKRQKNQINDYEKETDDLIKKCKWLWKEEYL